MSYKKGIEPIISQEVKKIIEEYLIIIFKDVYFNNENILKAKQESDRISEEIRDFILSYSEQGKEISEVDLLLKSKEKGLELVSNHDLVFFDKKIDKTLKMRAFLIPGLKVEITEENAAEKVTEDDLQAVDHELCVSFKTSSKNEFIKLGNLLDIKVTLAKALHNRTQNDPDIDNIFKQNTIFEECLEFAITSASNVLKKKS